MVTLLTTFSFYSIFDPLYIINQEAEFSEEIERPVEACRFQQDFLALERELSFPFVRTRYG